MSGIDRPRLALYIALGLIVCVLGARYLRATGIAVPAPPGATVGASGGRGATGFGGGSAAAPDDGTGGRAGADTAGSPPTPDTGAQAGAAAAGGVRIDEAAGGVVVVHVAGAVRRPGLYRLPAGSRVDDALRRAGGPKRHADVDAVNLAAKLEDGRQILVPLRAGTGAAGAASAGAGAAGAAGVGGVPAAPVNLNTATAEQLDTLDGIGPGLAARILAYRTAHNGFRSVQELGDVSGIGDKRLATLRPLVTV